MKSIVSRQPLIMVTNDDGITSPGLLEALEAVHELGEVLVVAPLTQQTAAGRSFPARDTQSEPERRRLVLSSGAAVDAYAINGTPAQAVRHGMLLYADRQPDLLVSGINYGENVGLSVTISGTVGAAIEGASFGVPALAASLETDPAHHLSNSTEVNFTTAGAFVRRLAQAMLATPLPAGVDILKLDVPYSATAETAWRITRVSRQRIVHSSVDEDGKTRRLQGYYRTFDLGSLERDSDAYALLVDAAVSLSPMTIDLSAPIDRRTALARTLIAVLGDAVEWLLPS